ncbi:MAG: hypothetical protein R3Y09_03790 [Clostridia bacterium]
MNKSNMESIWGNVNTCVEIALNIYEIYAQYGNGIVVGKGDQTILSDKALSLGIENGDYITFDESIKDVPMYEVLKQKLAENQAMQAEIYEKMQDIEKYGKYRYPQYFGEIPTPDHAVDEICLGVYMTETDEGSMFAVHKGIAKDYMTEMSTEIGIEQGEYLFYDLKTASMPLFELSKIFSEVDAMILEKDSLYATLTSRFTAYVEDYNELVGALEQIPCVNAPPFLYLESQIKQASVDLSCYVDDFEQLNDYGEEVDDFGFEP